MSKIITATNKATKSLLAASVALAKQSAELEVFTQVQSEVAFDIECKQSELAAVEQELNDNKRRAAAELNLAILEDEQGQLEKLMAKNGLATITMAELADLSDELETATYEVADRIRDAVSEALANANTAHETAIQRMDSEHSVANATKNASITALTSQNEQLSEQVSQLREQIAAERQARVSIAASDAAGRIHIPGASA